jgi:hypothetical protein
VQSSPPQSHGALPWILTGHSHTFGDDVEFVPLSHPSNSATAAHVAANAIANFVLVGAPCFACVDFIFFAIFNSFI